MGGQSPSTTQNMPPLIQDGMNNLAPDVVAKLQAVQPAYMTDQATQVRNGMENLPPDVVDMLKRLGGPSSAKRAPKRI